MQIYLKQRNKDDVRKYPNWRGPFPEYSAHSSLINFQSAKHAFEVPVKKDRAGGEREREFLSPTELGPQPNCGTGLCCNKII